MVKREVKRRISSLRLVSSSRMVKLESRADPLMLGQLQMIFATIF